MEPARSSPAGKGAAGPRPFRIANAFLDRSADVFAVLTEMLIFAMLAINAANIIVRNLGFSSLLWVWPWTGVLMIWSVFLAFFVMYRRDLDIRLTFVVQRFSPRVKKILKVGGDLVGLLIVSVFLIEAQQILNRQRGVIELVGIERYWLSVPLLASSAFLFLHFILEALGIALGYEAAEFAEDDGAMQW